MLALTVAVGACLYGLFLLSDSEDVQRDDAYSGVDIPPSTDLEALPPVLRRRASRKADDEGEKGVDREKGVSSPIELELEIISKNKLQGDNAGGEVTVGARLRPLVDSPDIRWFVKVPEGLSLIGGPASWEGKMEEGEERTFQLTFSVPDGKAYELYSRAESYLGNGDVVTKGAGLRIDLGPRELGDYPPFERVDSEGRRVISYKGKVNGSSAGGD